MTGNLELTFSDRLSSEQRDVAEASVRAMIEKAGADAASGQASRARRQERRLALTAPIENLIRADPKAAASLKALSEDASEAGGFDLLRLTDVPDIQGLQLPPPQLSVFTLAIPATPPFDYAWSYAVEGGGRPVQNQSDVQGNLIVNAKSGGIVGGADRFVNAHCGVGVVFSIDRTATIRLDASLDYRYKYFLDCHGLSANASADGGMDAALFSGPSMQMLGSVPLYHKRISGWEDETVDLPYAAHNFPRGMASQEGAGTYAFNLGIWAVSDYSGGIGGAAAQSACQAIVREMRIVAS